MKDFKSRYPVIFQEIKVEWSNFKTDRTVDNLQSFRSKMLALSTEIASSTLFPLQQVVSGLLDGCQRFLDRKITMKELILDSDWLLNQLEAGQQQNVDPFLVEENDASLDSNALTKHIVQHADLMRKKGNPTVAIIDDQKSVGVVISEILQTFAMNAIWYSSIQEFESKSTASDLILLDIVMPDISQEQVFEFAQRQIQQNRKVIFCSSMFSFETRIEAVRVGCSDYITKPVNSYTLIEKVTRVLGTNQTKKSQIILLDDQETMGMYYKNMLDADNSEVVYFDRAVDMFKQIDSLMPDMFLLDLVMPDVNGIEVARMIRYESKFDFVPIIFITADESDEARVNAISAGAEDVISKSSPVNLVKNQLLTRLERAKNISNYVAKDALTGVNNHGQILEISNQMIKRSRRDSSYLSVALIDLDKFKSVNDTYGHVAGDRVLFSLGQLLLNSVRETDAVGRWGGEEFIIIFERCDVKSAAAKLYQIKSSFKAINFISDDGLTFNVSFSAGVVQLAEKTELEEAIIQADKGLYKAKDAGRDKIATHVCK